MSHRDDHKIKKSNNRINKSLRKETKRQAKEKIKKPFPTDTTRGPDRRQGAGAGSKEVAFSDATDFYANKFHNFISFTSAISNDTVKFKAFLTSFEDQYNSDWNSEQVYGRNDPIQTFRSTTRNISLAWDAPAASVFEALDNMDAAARLIRMLYPSYESIDNVATIEDAPVIYVKFRNFISGQSLGDISALTVTLNGISFSPDLEAGFFDADESKEFTEIKRDELIPKLLKFSCEMVVLHEETIGHQQGQWPDTLYQFPNLPQEVIIPRLDDDFSSVTDSSQFGEDFNQEEVDAANERYKKEVEQAQAKLINAAKSDYERHEDKLEKLNSLGPDGRNKRQQKRYEKIVEAQEAAMAQWGDFS